ncbi:MAG: prolyl oligopeptidase family serine peptidase, partial [Pseudomonadota bacterium]
MFRSIVPLAVIAICSACATQQDIEVTTQAEDPYLWLEEVESEEALNWVRAQNDRSLEALKASPVYDGNEAAAIEALTSQARIPYGVIRDGLVYNFWQDDTNVRGLWRRTSLESYATEEPDWETLLDVDALAETEGQNWVFKGANCHKQEGGDRYFCMIALSDGGKDAVVNREFDIETQSFVEDGFVTPEAKQGLSWVDGDTMLVGTDWGGDGSTLTESGYPSIVKRWRRGQALESAEPLIEGQVSDVGVWPFALELEDGRMLQGAVEADTFFTSTYWLFPSDGTTPVKWPIPPKSTPDSVYQGQLLVSLQQDWSPEGQATTFQSGDIVAFDVEAFLVSGELPAVSLVFRPDEKQAANGVAIAKHGAILSYDDNVVGRIASLNYEDGVWSKQDIALPGSGQVGIAFASRHEQTVFLNYEDFLIPDSLLSYNSLSGTVAPLKSLPAKFDADGLVIHTKEATSKDGTKIPYFVVHHEDITLDGSNPTLLYAYGGFEISMRPSYSATLGRLWLEKGGVYVLANIRGGGEFGPKWHQAGLKTNRQRIYDDFIAVGESLIEMNLTQPEHLGIMGGSNGGLLMGVMLNQRPDLWNAVVVQVPLLDMLRYHLLLAGASWVDEYGSPDVPEERAFLETISPYQNFDAGADYPTPF